MGQNQLQQQSLPTQEVNRTKAINNSFNLKCQNISSFFVSSPDKVPTTKENKTSGENENVELEESTLPSAEFSVSLDNKRMSAAKQT